MLQVSHIYPELDTKEMVEYPSLTINVNMHIAVMTAISKVPKCLICAFALSQVEKSGDESRNKLLYCHTFLNL